MYGRRHTYIYTCIYHRTGRNNLDICTSECLEEKISSHYVQSSERTCFLVLNVIISAAPLSCCLSISLFSPWLHVKLLAKQIPVFYAKRTNDFKKELAVLLDLNHFVYFLVCPILNGPR